MRAVAFTVLVFFGMSMLGCKSVVNLMAFHPDKVHLIPTEELPPGVEELTIRTKDGVLLTSLYLPSPNSNKILIYFQGNAGNIYHRISALHQLHQLGINVIGVGYRGYGKSEGAPSEEGIYLDGESMFQYVTDHMGFSEENIIVFGRSVGTAVAIHTVLNKKLDGIILVSPLTSGRAQAKAMGLGSISSLAGDSFNNIEKIERIVSPLLVIHGTEDEVIPYSMGKELFDKANVEKEFVRIAGAGHNDLQDRFAKAYWSPIIRFIKNAMGSYR